MNRRVLSFGQLRLWALDRIEGGTASYNMSAAFRLHGALDVTALGSALCDVVVRHESLRTIILDGSAGPEGFVIPPDEVGVLLRRVDGGDGSGLVDLVSAEAGYVFDLSRDVLLRALVVDLGPQEHVLVLVMHHAAGDGLSIPIFVRDLAKAYGFRCRGLPAHFAPLRFSYADYASWQRRHFASEGVLDGEIGYWKDALSGIPDVLELPTDYVRHSDRSDIGA